MKCPKCNSEKPEIMFLREWMDFYNGDYPFALDNMKLEEYVIVHENEEVCEDCFDKIAKEVSENF